MPDLKTLNGLSSENLKALGAIPIGDIATIQGLTVVEGGTPFSPLDIAGMIYGFEADRLVLNNNDLVDSMDDFSGNGYHASEGSTGSRPTFITGATPSGLPAVRFNGSNGRQFGANPSAEESSFDLATYSIFWSFKRNSGNTIISKNTTAFSDGRRRKIHVRLDGGVRFGNGADGDSILFSSGVDTSVWHVGGVIARANNDHDLLYNSLLQNFTNTLADSTFNDARVEIGQAFSNGAERINGDMFSLLVYSGDIGTTARDALLFYMADKIGTSL